MTTGAKETARGENWHTKGPHGTVFRRHSCLNGFVWVEIATTDERGSMTICLHGDDLLAAAAWLAPAREVGDGAGLPTPEQIAGTIIGLTGGSAPRLIVTETANDHRYYDTTPPAHAHALWQVLYRTIASAIHADRARRSPVQFTSQPPTTAKTEPIKTSQEVWNRARAIADEGARRLAAGNYSSPEDACRSVAEEVVTELVIPAHAAGDSAGYARGLAEGRARPAAQARTPAPPAPQGKVIVSPEERLRKAAPVLLDACSAAAKRLQHAYACTGGRGPLDRSVMPGMPKEEVDLLEQLFSAISLATDPFFKDDARSGPVGEPGPGRDPSIQERATRLAYNVVGTGSPGNMTGEGLRTAIAQYAAKELTEAVAQARREERDKWAAAFVDSVAAQVRREARAAFGLSQEPQP